MHKSVQKLKISIIIPVLNEAAIIEKILSKLINNSNVEIVVVDGGSRDQTVQLAQQMGVKVTNTPTPGRAKQMNAGAAIATGDIFLFLHADTRLPKDYEIIVREILAQPKVIVGAFELAIDGKEKLLRLVEILANLRSRFFSLPYGDQAIFLKRSVFWDLGGFPDLPIMEDFELVKRLRRLGKIAIAPAAVLTSGRRWQKLGVLQTTIINQLIIIGYYLGISPLKLRNFYRRKRIN